MAAIHDSCRGASVGPEVIRRPAGRVLGLCAAVVLSSAAGALGDEEGVRVRTVGGPFAMYYPTDGWVERHANVDNRTDRTQQVSVRWLANHPGRGQVIYERLAVIPSKVRRRVRVAVQLGELRVLKAPGSRDRQGADPSDEKKRKLPTCEEPYGLVNAETGQQVDLDFRMVLKIEPQTTTLAVVSSGEEDTPSYNYLDEMPGQELGSVQFVGTRVTSLPDRWYGYSVCRILMLGGLEIASLRTSQIQALLAWVRRGGVLVLTGSQSMEEMLLGELGTAAGAAALGYHRPKTLHVTEAGKPLAEPVELPEPVTLSELLVEDAEVAFEANGIPLLTRRTTGRGTVFALSVPPGALEDPRLHRVWLRVGEALSARPPVDAESFSEAAEDTLQSIAGRRGPRRTLPVGLLAVLAAGVCIGGLLLRLVRRGEIVWVLLVPVSLAMAGGIYAYGRRQADPERLSNVGLISGLGDGAARCQQAFGYYTPEATTLTFSAGDPRGTLADVGEVASGAVAKARVRTSSTIQIPDVSVQDGGTAALYADAVIAAEGLTGPLSFGPEGVTGTLTHAFGTEVADAVVMANRRTYRLGALPPGTSTEVTVGPADFLDRVVFLEPERTVSRPRRRVPTATRRGPSTVPAADLPPPTRGPDKRVEGEFTGSLVHTQLDGLRNDLVRRLISAPGIGRPVGREPLLIGYLEHTPIDPLPGRRLARQGWSVVVWPIALTAPPAGRRVLVPDGFVDVRYEQLGAPVWDSVNERFNFSHRGMEMIVHARPPSVIRELTDVTMRVAVSLRGSGYRLTVSGVSGDAARTRVPLATFIDPSGPQRVEVPEAGRFRDAAGGFQVSLNVESTGPPGPAAAEIGSPRQWKFETIDVSLEGISQ